MPDKSIDFLQDLRFS